MSRQKINIETLVWVAVWKQPSIFQGCFKIKALSTEHEVVFFFRCEYENWGQINTIDEDFSPHDYQFTHLYNREKSIPIDGLDQIGEYILYIMKYALHITLGEMITSRKQHFVSIDNIAMEAMIEIIKPLLNEGFVDDTKENHIGFAVAIDFCPHEEAGRLAVARLLAGLNGDSKSNAH